MLLEAIYTIDSSNNKNFNIRLKKEVITGNTVKSGKILVGDLDKYISQINDEKSVESYDLKKEPLPTIEPNQAASNKYVSEEYFKYNPYSYFDIENEMVK